MSPQTLFGLGAGAAILGGGLRIAAALIPYTPQSPVLEVLYAVIDLSLLFGLVAIYLRVAPALGWPGLLAFAVSGAGLASIVGPDTEMFGIDWYQMGATGSALGLAGLSVVMVLAGRRIGPSIMWLAVLPMAVFAPGPVANIAPGVLFGLGFVWAGLSDLSATRSERSRPSQSRI
ncbi:MAG TPA: hypothetical protein DCL48_08495 [Alphaproteobacteria bacterium]|nr:hypothetical protein [Alphaproteobacteria bacterium]